MKGSYDQNRTSKAGRAFEIQTQAVRHKIEVRGKLGIKTAEVSS
jgi:hypothetical protein